MLKTKSKDCTGCGVCAFSCPAKCIKMTENKEHFIEPIVEKEGCINCDICNKVCPVVTKKENDDSKTYYILQLKDKEVLKECASGGAFYGLAKQFLDFGGIVYGVSTNNTGLLYKRVDKITELSSLLGSKYYQCNLTDKSYNQIIKDSYKNKILVSGTPCQISAIKNLKKAKQDNIYTVEIICQGVPNQFVIKKYYEEYEKKKNKKIVNHNFRSKDKYIGQNYLNKYFFDDGSIEYFVGEQDPLTLSFQRGIYLRNSCYNCRYANEKRTADFVVGDYWKEDFHNKKIDLKKGVSALMCNTSKARDMFKRNKLFEKEEADESIFKHNIPFHRSVKKPFSRRFSFELLNYNIKPSIISKICCYKYYIKKIIKGDHK